MTANSHNTDLIKKLVPIQESVPAEVSINI